MPNVTFLLKLDSAALPGNQARLWLDTSRDDIIEPGEEVALSTIDAKAWTADVAVASPTTGMEFLVKFIAPIGTNWSFTANVSGGGATLYDSGAQKTTTLKEGLAGRLK